jgi:hypothetical protein
MFTASLRQLSSSPTVWHINSQQRAEEVSTGSICTVVAFYVTAASCDCSGPLHMPVGLHISPGWPPMMGGM